MAVLKWACLSRVPSGAHITGWGRGISSKGRRQRAEWLMLMPKSLFEHHQNFNDVWRHHHRHQSLSMTIFVIVIVICRNTFFSRFQPLLFILNLFQWFHVWNQNKKVKNGRKKCLDQFLGAPSTLKLVEIHNSYLFDFLFGQSMLKMRILLQML